MPKPQEVEFPSLEEAGAIKALYEKRAEPHQQEIALEWIIAKLCGTYSTLFQETDRETNFALGKQHVGNQLIGVCKLDLNQHEQNLIKLNKG